MKFPAFTGDVERLADALIAKFLMACLQSHDSRDDVVKIICLPAINRHARSSRISREDNSNVTLMRFDINTKPLNLGLQTQVIPVYRCSAPTEVGRLTDVTVEELNLPVGLNEEQEVQTQQLVHDKLKSAVPSSTRVHVVEVGDVEDLSQVITWERLMRLSEENRLEENLELRSDTEVQKTLQVRQGLGRAFAWLYVVDRVLPVLASLRLQVDELVQEFPNMLMKLVIVLSDPLAASGSFIRVKGFIGTGSQRSRNVCRCDVYELRDQENDVIHHVVMDEPYPAIILKSMYKEGKLSDQAYRTELRNFFSGLVEILEVSALGSCLVQEDDVRMDEKGAGIGRTVAEWLLSTVRNYNQGCAEESECDTELDGPEICLFESTSVDTNTVSALSTTQTVEPWNSVLYVLDKELERRAGLDQNWSWKMLLDTEAEEWTTDVIDTLMILTAAKETGLIGDLNFREITAGRFSSIQQTRIAIDLVLYWSRRYSVRYKMLLDKLRQMLSSATNVSSAEQQPNASEAADSNGKLLEERRQINIFTNILFTMITDKKYYPYDFEIQLRKLAFNLNFDVSQVQNENGESLLHAIVICNRQPFCLSLFRLGCWKDIYPKKVDKDKGSAYEEKTADEICAILKYSKLRKELDSFVVWEKSLNLIHMAVRIGDLKEVQRLLDFSSDLHQEQDSMGCTSLYWGVVGGNERVVDLLLSLKVDHNIVNSRKESILHIACVMGHDHLIKKLVLHLKMDYNVKDGAKKSALQRVAENGDEKSLVQFFECGLGVDRLKSLLAVAGHFGRLNFIRSAVEKYHVDPQSKDEVGKSAFLRAAEQGKVEVLKYLMSKNFDVTETDNRRRNVLHLVADGATKEAMEFIIRELKDRNVDVKTMINERDKYIGGELCMLIRGKDGGRDSWHYVEVSRGLVSLFLKRTRGGTVDVGRYGTLLSSGWGVDPDINAVKDIEQRFEARRASTMSTTDFDVTPLHIAAFRDKLDLAIILLESGADPNVRDKFGLTVLHTAAMRGNLAMVKLLLNKGATSDALDNLVKTPADVADDNEHNDVSTYIRSQKYLQPVEEFRDRILPNVQRLLSAEQIERMRTERHDIRSYLVNTLRDLAVNINEALVSLDSGPVLEETSS